MQIGRETVFHRSHAVQDHDRADVEKVARTQGAIFYSSKPLETERVGWVLLNFLRHLSERENRQAPRHVSSTSRA